MDYRYTRLKNGLRLATIPMLDRNSTAVTIWVRTGSRFESKKIGGISHFLEHMLFKGTKKRTARQIKEEIEGVGGLLNAFTGEEVTCYFSKLLHQNYPKALDVLSDMVNHAILDLTELNKERAVILEEIKMYKDQPAQYVQELMGEIMWPNQALGRPIAGSEKSVTSISRSDMVGFKNNYYHPKNILVTVAGPVYQQEVLQVVESCFAHETRLAPSRFTRVLSRQYKPQTHFVEKDTEQTHFVIGLHGFSRYHPDRYKLVLLNVLLGANMSSRLFEEIREKRGLAYEIRSSLSFFEDAGAVIISAGVETKKTPKAIALILKELEKINKRGITEDELRRAKEYFISQFYMTLEDTLDHALWIGERLIYADKIPDLEEIRQGIESVTTDQVREVARNIFKTANLNLTLIGPVKDKIQNHIKKDFAINTV